jgi:hypothetical protein
MSLIRSFVRMRRLEQLRIIRQVRRDHADCFYHSPILGGSIDRRYNKGPTSGFSREEALRIGRDGSCGTHCRKDIARADFGIQKLAVR